MGKPKFKGWGSTLGKEMQNHRNRGCGSREWWKRGPLIQPTQFPNWLPPCSHRSRWYERAFLALGGSLVPSPHIKILKALHCSIQARCRFPFGLWEPFLWQTGVYCKPKSPNLDRQDGLGRQHQWPGSTSLAFPIKEDVTESETSQRCCPTLNPLHWASVGRVLYFKCAQRRGTQLSWQVNPKCQWHGHLWVTLSSSWLGD